MEFRSLGNPVPKSKERETASGASSQRSRKFSEKKRPILIHTDVLLRNCLVIIIVFAIFISWGWGQESEISRYI